MRVYAVTFLAVAAVPSAASVSIPLVTFDGASSTTHKFTETNDPVMGGRSTGTFTVENGIGIFDGEVVDVPSLSAPGFIKADSGYDTFPDISSCSSIVIEANTSTLYDGYRLSFGTKRAFGCSFFSSGFKSHFDAPVTGGFENITIPLTSFSDCNSDATGEPTRNCTDDKSVCPDTKTLQNIETLGIWGEGALGKVHFEIKSISAEGCDAEDSDARALADSPAEVTADDVALVTFDGASGTTHRFVTLNDPVMGGRSNGTFQIIDNVGVFEGNVNIVPKLQAPGFLEAWADDGDYVDASSAASGSLVLTVRSSTADYAGYRVSFAAGALSPSFSCASGGAIIGSKGCYKADFTVPAGDDFVEVEVPFNSFSDEWSSFTGEPTTRCADDDRVCPTAEGLKRIQAIGVWAEGKEGPIHLEIKSIVARPAASQGESKQSSPSVTLSEAFSDERITTRPPQEYDTCSGHVQDNLRYNMSQFNTPAGVPVNVSASESLATAICCDSRTKVFAEPRSLFSSPSVDLFGTLNTSGPTTFYDSVCGIPLFRAPVNRTFEEFKQESISHGWPSFRKEEVVQGNVITDKNGFVYSKCGTHLGSYLPDDQGDRWCLDLSCLSGNPTTTDSSRRLRGRSSFINM